MLPLIGMPQGWEWLIVLAIFILVFGAAKLPDLARGTGQALRIFKSETKGLRDDDDEPKSQPKGELGAADPVNEAKTADSEVAEGEIVDERKHNA
jgi:sec-independent protein translocase protein TatA